VLLVGTGLMLVNLDSDRPCQPGSSPRVLDQWIDQAIAIQCEGSLVVF
jgi:hypothetical protein